MTFFMLNVKINSPHFSLDVKKIQFTFVAMAHGFGQLAKVYGIVTYKLSPFEQRAFAGAISKGVPNMVRRFRSNVFTVAPPFIVAYLVYDYVETLHKKLSRKDPAEFANDV